MEKEKVEPKVEERDKMFEVFQTIRSIIDLKKLDGIPIHKLNRKKLLRVIGYLVTYSSMLEKNIK